MHHGGTEDTEVGEEGLGWDRGGFGYPATRPGQEGGSLCGGVRLGRGSLHGLRPWASWDPRRTAGRMVNRNVRWYQTGNLLQMEMCRGRKRASRTPPTR